MKKRKINKGFTLIEMMVSVSLFVVVALIVSGVLVQLSAVYKKAQAMRLLMDNFNFALEKMNLEIREGVKIELKDSDRAIKYSQLGDEGNSYCYSLGDYNNHENTLLKCKNECPCGDSSEGVKDMLSPQIFLSSLNFKITERGIIDNKLAKVLININGRAVSRPGLETEFMIQTSASQRTTDF
ncbi:MAG: type II secretion system protein [Candidatus Paceibacterota bacterium]